MISGSKKTIIALLISLSGQQLFAHWLWENRSLAAFMVTSLGIGAWGYHRSRVNQSGVSPSMPLKKVSMYYESKNSQKLVVEPVEWPVKLVYDNNPLSWILSWAAGYLGGYVTRRQGEIANSQDAKLVRDKIAHYTSFYKDVLNMDEFAVPPQGFKTFNDWFIRTFKNIDASRPMDANPCTIVSPADSKVLIIPNLSQDTRMTIKEKRFNIAQFLGDASLARTFEGGVMMIFRLSPYDYHRYHYPFDCTVGCEQFIDGLYHSVNPRAFNVGCKPLTVNKRSYELLTPAGTCAARSSYPIVMVQVGATAVASIVNNFMDYDRGVPRDSAQIYQKGSELGYFQFGGSTVVLLFPANTIVPDAQLVQNSLNGYETAVKVRETIATWIAQR